MRSIRNPMGSMRICIVTHYCKPHIGGIETVSFEEAKQLIRLGHQVTLVSSKTFDEPLEEITQGVKIRRGQASSLLEQKLGVPYPLFDCSLIHLLEEELANADVCIIHGFAFQTSLIASSICHRWHVPYVIIQHNTFINYRNPFFNLVQRINDFFIGRYVLRQAVDVVAVSEQTANYVEMLVNRRPKVLYNGVDTRRFHPICCAMPIRQALGIPSDKFIILTVRRFFYKNGVQTLLDSAFLLKDNPRLHFVVVGSGPEQRTIETRIRDLALTNCTIMGNISDRILPLVYESADVFVFPSLTGEGLGQVILEAYASGLPVICVNGGGQKEIVLDGITGFLVNPNSPEQIAVWINYCFQNPVRLKQMSIESRKYVESILSLDMNSQKLEAILLEAINFSRGQFYQNNRIDGEEKETRTC